MQLKAVLLSLLAATASAAPSGKPKPSSCPAPDRKFVIMSLRSASPVHYGSITAVDNKLWIWHDESTLHAKCDRGNGAPATFRVSKDGELFLYGRDSLVQQFYVDRSGMGQGNLGYFNKGSGGPPRNGELKGWVVDRDGYLTFGGASILACPSEGFSYVLWVSAGIEKPAGIEGCLEISARTLTAEEPIKCTYSTLG